MRLRDRLQRDALPDVPGACQERKLYETLFGDRKVRARRP